jgi:VPDSG-CTERM motif
VTVLPQQAPDQWTVTFPDTFNFGGFTFFWQENPIGSDLLGNIVDAPGGNQLSVFSDVPTGHSPAGEPNGSIQSSTASESGNPVTVNFTFNDIGDGSSSVPDTGSTLGLFIVSLIALLAARRSSVPTA